jgi:hypothetical protein
VKDEARKVQVGQRTIETAKGALTLVPATVDQLRGVARYWPMELVTDPKSPGQYGLVFQRGEQELHGIKLQPPDTDEADAKTFHHVNRALIAAALPFYLEKGHRGVMVPCAYYKQKTSGLIETGFALFVGPDASSRPASDDLAEVMYDDRLGAGATSMIGDMAGAIARAQKETRLPGMTVIGVDVRPRLAMGGLAMHFVIAGRQVLVAKAPLDESEAVWSYLVGAGFSTLPYAPMIPAGLPTIPPADTPRA